MNAFWGSVFVMISWLCVNIGSLGTWSNLYHWNETIREIQERDKWIEFRKHYTTSWYINQVPESEWGERKSSMKWVMLELHLKQFGIYKADKIGWHSSLWWHAMA